MLDALLYSAMSVPQFALESFPAGALVGALLGIGVLARSQELTVMRASGMSKLRLSAAALISAGLLIGVVAADRGVSGATARASWPMSARRSPNTPISVSPAPAGPGSATATRY
jgi:lipopolysaccharide export LptBFGC system permease protein LptF